MIKKPTRKPQINQTNLNYYSPDRQKTLAEHIDEIRFRLFWIVTTVLLASGVGYLLHKQLLLLVQKPLGSELYYTSPAGGISFIFKLCFSFAFVVALPVVLYHIMRFFFPVVAHIQQRTITRFIIASVVLAYSGVVFAYFVSLPAALHFLSNIGNYSLSALITVDTYYDFVVAYLMGFALLFQTPIIVLFINKIKPLKPGGMMGAQRYIILVSFIVAALLTPTPDPINQTIMAMPAIILYQVSVFMVWRINKKNKPLHTLPFSNIPEDVVAAAALKAELPEMPAISAAALKERTSTKTTPAPAQVMQEQKTPQTQRVAVQRSSPEFRMIPVKTRRAAPSAPRVMRPMVSMDVIPV